jgi:glycosyltransferase involved in cell wall biosynthesis
MPDVEFRFGGSGILYSSLEKRAGSNAKFLGWVDSDSFWKGCDIAILTSANEAMPFSLIEAQSMGIPVVTVQAGSAGEVVEHEKTGFVVKDLVGMEEALRKLIDSPVLYQRMSQASRDLISNSFSPERMFEEHISAYRNTLITLDKK